MDFLFVKEVFSFNKPTKVAYRVSQSWCVISPFCKGYPLPTSSHFEKGGKRYLIKGDTEKSTPPLLYERKGFIVISPFDKGGKRGI